MSGDLTASELAALLAARPAAEFTDIRTGHWADIVSKVPEFARGMAAHYDMRRSTPPGEGEGEAE